LLASLVNDALNQSQDRDCAAELLDIAAKAGIEDVEVLLAQARFDQRRGFLDTAESALHRACELVRSRGGRRNAWPFFYLAKLLTRRGDLPEAEQVLLDGEEFCFKHEIRSATVLRAIQGQLGTVYLY